MRLPFLHAVSGCFHARAWSTKPACLPNVSVPRFHYLLVCGVCIVRFPVFNVLLQLADLHLVCGLNCSAGGMSSLPTKKETSSAELKSQPPAWAKEVPRPEMTSLPIDDICDSDMLVYEYNSLPEKLPSRGIGCASRWFATTCSIFSTRC